MFVMTSGRILYGVLVLSVPPYEIPRCPGYTVRRWRFPMMAGDWDKLLQKRPARFGRHSLGTQAEDFYGWTAQLEAIR